MASLGNKFHLDKRNGKLMGVCAGIADYTGWDVTLVRIGTALFGQALIDGNSMKPR